LTGNDMGEHGTQGDTVNIGSLHAEADDTARELVVQIAQENVGWGYDRVVGALANRGYTLSDETVGNILRRNDIPSALERKQTTTWKEFIRAHMAVLAGTDVFTVEVLTLHGLVTYYVLFFIHLESRRVEIAGITSYPNEVWMRQIARNVTMDEWGFLDECRYLLHDRDTKYTHPFRQIIKSGGVAPLRLPPRSPNLNAYAERWVKSVKDEYLSKLVLFGEASLRHTLRSYLMHYHGDRNHQGKDNMLLFPTVKTRGNFGDSPARCGKRLGGLLKHYHREAA